MHNPERLVRWFLRITGDLRVGGHYELEDNAEGTLESCDPPNRFAATWEYGGDVSWIEVRITENQEGGARLALEHIALIDEHWDQFGPGAAGIGWEMGLIGLSVHLEERSPVDSSEFETWITSEEGQRFVSTSSDRWRTASVAFGTDPDHASEAAERTTAFYTGPDS